jgi:hypothetical protein
LGKHPEKAGEEPKALVRQSRTGLGVLIREDADQMHAGAADRAMKQPAGP